MKKFYSLVLMATALLIGTNVNAAKIAEMTIGGVTTDVENLWDAFRDLPADATATIKMVADAAIVPGTGAASNNPSALWVNDGQSITLDLNGHNITSSARFNFGHASFTLTGQGIYDCSVSQALNCYGSEDSNAPYGWSAITIGKDVTLNDQAGYALGILYAGIRYGYNATAAPSKKAPLSHADSVKYFSSCGVQVDVYGKLISQYGIASNGNMKYNVGNIPVLNIHPTALIQGDNTLTEMVGDASLYSNSDDKKVANAIAACADAPVYPDGHQYAGKKYYKTTNAGLYCPGYMHYNIYGTVTGGVGVYVKAGDVNIDNATILATSAEMWTPIKYSNGFIGAGSAIIFDSNSSYSAEGMSIDVTGDSYVSSTSGYAIQDLITSGQEKMEANDVNIESGTFIGATVTNPETGQTETLCINFTDDLGEEIKETGSISGGTYNSTDVQEYINTTGDGIIVPVETAEGTVYVVAEKPSGTAWVSDLNTAPAGAYVKLNAAGSTILSADKDVKYLNITAAHTVIIPEGKTLTVGEIVLGEDAVIDVKLGGKLIAAGKNGIVAFENKNILIAAKEGQMGKFMQSPAVTSNKNPHATVTLETKAHKEGGNYVYQRIGVPAFGGITVAEMTINPASAGIGLAYWDAATQGWAWVPSTSYVVEPFVGLALTNDATTEGTKYAMPCRLMGNSDANLTLMGAWTSFANSYMADVDLYELLGDIKDAATGASASAYVYDAPNNWWKTISYGDLETWKNGGAQPAYTKLEPMQGFIFNNIDPAFNATALISYEKDVWAPVFGPTPNPAPARVMSNDNTTRVQIVITAANGQSDDITLRQSEDFSAAFDNGYDVKENVNINPINIFATTELGEMAQLSTDNLVGTKLSVATKGETAFTMTFKNLNGETLAIRDNMTGSVIDMTEGAEYVFSVAENSVSERFEIVGIKTVPTGMESIQKVEGTKAIYTILGQYVGTVADWSVLPAGIYVIDGVKVVK